MAKLRILFVSSEQAPYAKAGGLGEVMFALPRSLRAIGHDARVMMPRYGHIDLAAYPFQMLSEGLEVPSGSGPDAKKLICNVRYVSSTGDSHSPVPTYFLENQEYFEMRANVYGYNDDPIRFALLSRGCLEFLKKHREWKPNIIVCTDWMTGYIPNFLNTDFANDRTLKKIATVLSIHNLASHPGTFNPRFIQESEQDDGHGPLPDFFSPRMAQINPLRRSIMHADIINTVSSTYAKEIMTEEFGEGLDGLLRERRGRLVGILNGIDYETNNPETDPRLASTFSARSIERRKENKLALQQRLGLPQDPNVFLMGIVSRLFKQKGFKLLAEVAEPFLKETKGQLIIVGDGDTELMTLFNDLSKKYPAQIVATLRFDEELPHLVFAGSDVILVPSYFEPSGLTQMEAMRYGAVPVARRVGGLADTIEDYQPDMGGSGFLFTDFDAYAFLIALTRAFVNWKHTRSWRKLQRIVMQKDFSWQRSAKAYEKLFRLAIQYKKQSGAGANKRVY
ncbi:MAG: glycogen synthase [bacterium]|nr:glycogen synthase [bacterium]